MPRDAAARLHEVLLLLPRLADGAVHRFEELERALGADRETILADLRAISQRDDEPGGFVSGFEVTIEADGITVRTQPFRRPMRLTVSELCALELGLAVLRSERPDGEHPAIDNARLRLRQVIARMPDDGIPDGLRFATHGDLGPPAHIAQIRRAVREHRKLRIEYHGGSAREPGSRVIRPYSLTAGPGTLYLVAHCERSAGIRIFRLDRILSLAPLAATYEIPADFSLAQVMQEGRLFISERPTKTMKVRYSARIARWIAEHQERTPDADGTITVDHPLADREWAVRQVLQYGPDAEVLTPPDVRAEVRRRLAAMRPNSGSRPAPAGRASRTRR